jgi:hypothetical protein
MKRVPRGHPLCQGFEGRNALSGRNERPPKRVPRETLLWSGCKGRAPLPSGKTAQKAGSGGRLWSPPGEECCLQHITSPFLRSPVGSLRPGLECSLTARGYYDNDCAPAKCGGRSDERGVGCLKSRNTAATLILRDKRQRTMV